MEERADLVLAEFSGHVVGNWLLTKQPPVESSMCTSLFRLDPFLSLPLPSSDDKSGGKHKKYSESEV